MNIQILTTSKQTVFALLAISTVGLLASPAKADNALIQESVQESVVTGRDNISIQNSNQSHQQYTEYRDRSNNYNRHHRDNYNSDSSTGVVQRSEQYCDQVGEYNTCVQDAQQSSSIHNRRDRRYRRH